MRLVGWHMAPSQELQPQDKHSSPLLDCFTLQTFVKNDFY